MCELDDDAYAVRSELSPFCPRLDWIGSGSKDRPWSSRRRNPRLTDPSGLMLPRGASSGGEGLSDSGDPIGLPAASTPEACIPWVAGTTRFRRLITDFFMVTGRCTPWSL